MTDTSSTNATVGSLQIQRRAPAGAVTPTPVVVWDVDGTLTRSDTLIPFLRRLLGTFRLARTVAAAASQVRPGRGWRTAGKTELLHAAVAGRDLDSVNRIARRYAAELTARRLRPDSRRRWQWHRQQGHHLVLASASPDLYIRHLGGILGANDVISTEMKIVDGRLTGRMATANCRGEEKARRLGRYLAEHPCGPVWVYTDSLSDRPILLLADIAVRVRPHRRLRTPPDMFDCALRTAQGADSLERAE